jgi:lysozyme family protein
MQLTTQLKQEYQNLWDTMVITDIHYAFNELHPLKITGMGVYTGYGGIPPAFIAAIHYRECDLNLKQHLANGDSLKARTVNAPAGRIPLIEPPYTFQQSIEDAITLNKWDKVQEWDLPTQLYYAEAMNGFGVRKYHQPNLTGYLWSYTTHYTGGKYDTDGHYNPTLKDAEIGVAVALRVLTDKTLLFF